MLHFWLTFSLLDCSGSGKETFFFVFLKSNKPACSSYAMAGGVDGSGRTSRTKNIENTTRSDTWCGITPSAKVLNRQAEAYILIGKQTHRTPRHQGAEPKLGLMREAIHTQYPYLSPYCHSVNNTWLTAGISRAMPAPPELPLDLFCSLASAIQDQPDKRKKLPRNNKGDLPQHIPSAGAPLSCQRSKRD